MRFEQYRVIWQQLRECVAMWVALVTLAASSGIASAETTTITVWDFKSADPSIAAYFQQTVKDFEAVHLGVIVKHVAQPHDQYYSLLGAAIGANQGPDIVMLHGGTPTRERAGALVALNPDLGRLRDRLVGWEAFSAENNTIYAVPLTLQGQVVYYNKDLYRKAGLDPDKPPVNWAELEADCTRIIARLHVACFAMGNKDGYGSMFFFNSIAANSWSDAQRAAWADRKLAWSDPAVSSILRVWVEKSKAGWYTKGVNSTATFPDQYDRFMRGEAANVIGLVSDTAHWKQFEAVLGPDKVGSYLPVALPGSAGANAPGAKLSLPIAGGIGWAITRWSPHKDLALAYVKSMVSSTHLRTLFETGGAMVSGGQFSRDGIDSPNGKKILEWISCCRAPMPQNSIGLSEVEVLRRDTQRMLAGSMSVEAATSELDQTRTSSR
ncbi:raffinose/stachyose/melibiose transport system substrate-binding protein [Paraburkholderia atlantica]|uniref:ABC transporter substrate-binding protein n=1 Tax=Paraburkholderia atlantica TaxID=2654982 RepID=UPI003D1F9D4A